MWSSDVVVQFCESIFRMKEEGYLLSKDSLRYTHPGPPNNEEQLKPQSKSLKPTKEPVEGEFNCKAESSTKCDLAVNQANVLSIENVIYAALTFGCAYSLYKLKFRKNM